MQHFLPYTSFYDSLSCLDNKRAGKQRIESYDSYGLITDFKITNHSNKQKEILIRFYRNHPAVNMWRGYEDALALYYNTSLVTWCARKNKKGLPFKNNMIKLPIPSISKIKIPSWIGNKTFHKSHQSNLLRKKPDWYLQFNWNVPDNLPYYWPTNKLK